MVTKRRKSTKQSPHLLSSYMQKMETFWKEISRWHTKYEKYQLQWLIKLQRHWKGHQQKINTWKSKFHQSKTAAGKKKIFSHIRALQSEQLHLKKLIHQFFKDNKQYRQHEQRWMNQFEKKYLKEENRFAKLLKQHNKNPNESMSYLSKRKTKHQNHFNMPSSMAAKSTNDEENNTPTLEV